ncbi:MAG TPA: histidine kinase [Niastella sp.]
MLWKERSTCSVYQDPLFYIGTTSGLYTIDAQRKSFFLGARFPIFKTRISDIKASAGGIVWIATCGKGIAGYKDGRLMYMFTEKEGLSSDICRTIFITNEDVWVGTDKGISLIQKSGPQYRVVQIADAEALNADIVNTIYVDHNTVYVGTTNGITYFDVKNISNHSFCKLRVTAITANDRTLAYDTSGLVLPNNKNSIRVDFVGISYRSDGEILYRYRLKGLNDQWQTTRETFLSYPTLPSGKYELEITATNKFGIQSAPIHIAFMVEQSFWEKPWVIFTGIVLIAGIIWFFITRLIRVINARNAEKLFINNRMAELEQMALKAQMNPHFIFNSLNSIHKYVMEKDIIGANKFITDFSRLIRFTLELSSRSKVSIDEEIKYLDTYLKLENARFGNDFSYQLIIDPGIDRLQCHIPPMILQPYIENSIRHGVRYLQNNTGKITVRFTIKEPYLECTVEDNGIGRKQSQVYKGQNPVEYQSKGMTLTARRLQMLNTNRSIPILLNIEDLETTQATATGTKVVICFPLQYVYNKNVHT